MRISLKSYLEHSALTGWRRFLNWRPGQRAAAKRSYNKRVRKDGKKAASAAAN